MLKMFNLLKKIFYFIGKHRRSLILITVMTVLFFSLRFPWNNLIEKTVRDFQKTYSSSFQTDFDKLHLKFFPPGVQFKNPSLSYKKKKIFLDSLEVSIALTKWLAFKKALQFKAIKEISYLSVEFWKKEKILTDDSADRSAIIYFVKGYSPLLELQILNNLFPDMKMSGAVKTHFNYEGSLNRVQEAKASFNLKGENIRLSQTEIHTPLGPLSFPPIYWKQGEVVSLLKDGELIFKTLHLGSPSDDFIIQMKGSGAIFFSYGKIHLNSYDIQLQIDADKDLQMSLLDLMFSGYKEDKGDFYRYRLRLTGQGNQVPHMEKLSEF